MKYMKLTDEQKERHPSIHYTGSVRGMKKLGYWGKHDVCVRCGQYIYNISIWLDPNRSNKTERPKEELPQAYLDILENVNGAFAIIRTTAALSSSGIHRPERTSLSA